MRLFVTEVLWNEVVVGGTSSSSSLASCVDLGASRLGLTECLFVGSMWEIEFRFCNRSFSLSHVFIALLNSSFMLQLRGRGVVADSVDEYRSVPLSSSEDDELSSTLSNSEFVLEIDPEPWEFSSRGLIVDVGAIVVNWSLSLFRMPRLSVLRGSVAALSWCVLSGLCSNKV